MRLFFLAMLFLSLSYAPVLAGMKADEQLEEAVVTATRTERATEEIPAGVSAVTKEDIKNTRMFGIKEALTGISGVQSESRNGGYDSRLIIRGAGLKARYGVREIMILLDGVPITDPDGMTRLDFVDTQVVDRIDIVKGPNSTLYGANAAGGVINIISKSPFEKGKGIKIGYGSDNTQMYNLNYGTNIGKTFLSITGSRRSTDSWRAWNEFSTNQGGIKLGYMVDDVTTIEGVLNYTKADIQLPGGLTKAEFERDIKQLTSDIWRHMGRYSEVFSANLKLEKEIGNIKLKPIVYFSTWKHYHPVTGLINDGGANVYGIDIQADLKHSVFSSEGLLTMGAAGQLDKADGEKYTYRNYAAAGGRMQYTLSDEKDILAEAGNDTTSKWGIYVQESLRPSDRWIVDVGLRYDQVAFDINNEQYWKFNYSTAGPTALRYIADRQSVRRDKTFDYFSPKVSAIYKLSKVINLYGNVSTGFQTPQSSELSLNPNLEPLNIYNYEGGLKARFDGGHSLDLSMFYMTVKDEIVQTIEPGNVSSYSNAGESQKKGIEFSGRIQPVKGLSLGGSYTYSDFKFEEFIEPVRAGAGYVYFDRSGKRYPYVPTNQYSLFANYKHPSGFKFRVDTNTWGKYYVDNANSETYSGYSFLTNVLLGYEKKDFDISMDVYNIFDKRYAMEATKESGAAAATKFRPGAPIAWMIRASYKF